MVKVELLDDVEGLGQKGDRVSLPAENQSDIARIEQLKKEGLVKEMK